MIPARPEQIHLYRGSPAIRSWSRHKSIDLNWTLCGIYRATPAIASGAVSEATDNPARVTCKYCLDLMRPSAREERRTP